MALMTPKAALQIRGLPAKVEPCMPGLKQSANSFLTIVAPMAPDRDGAGEVIEVGGKSLDNPGFDLTGLMVGSEGTLGMVTKLTLRMMPKTEAVKTMLAIYDTIADGANTVSGIVKAGMIPTTLEMMDNLTIKAVEAAYHVGFPEDAAAMADNMSNSAATAYLEALYGSAYADRASMGYGGYQGQGL